MKPESGEPMMFQNPKTMKRSIVQIAFTLAACASVSAQPPQQGGERRPPLPCPIVSALDADHDRIISAAEIQAATGVLLSIDKNGDGEITPDELRMPPPDGQNPLGWPKPPTLPEGKVGPDGPDGPQGHKPPMPSVVAALDVDHDGRIFSAELAGSLKALDKDGDGELSPKELRPPRPPHDQPEDGPPAGYGPE
jgi:hypothetical protein